MFKSLFVLLCCLVMLWGVAMVVSAASVFDITFPVAELENCADKNACKSYCDELSHANACAAFAKKYGFGDARATKQAAALPNIGPGGCKSTTECKNYCDDTNHFDECIQFAESNGLLNKKEIQQARKAITKGPGGCSDITECKQYCSEKDNHLDCADYAHRQGQISDNDYKAIKDVKEQGGPGGCRGNDECHSYCQDEKHLDECLSFSQDHGFISKDDALTIRKAGFGGAGPGGCKGNDACRAFCELPEHQNECIDFAEQKGFMSKEEVTRARKFVGKIGPGGCRGDACRTFCEDPANAEMCLEYAEREGLLPKEEIERAHKFLKTAQEGGGPGGCKNGRECGTYCQDQTHQQECFEFGKKQGFVKPEEERQFKAGMDIRKKVEQSGGPGGCKGDDECRIYCTDPAHTEECIAFASAHGGIDADQARMMLNEFTTGKFSGGGSDSFEDFQRGHEDSAARFQEFKQLEEQFRGGRGEERGGFSPSEDRRSGSPPGRFPGQQPRQGGGFGNNFGAGEQNFVGPGGCSGPAECIKYCSEHKEECFSGGSQGQRDSKGQGDVGRQENSSQFGRPQFGRPQFDQRFKGESQRSFEPQLRGNIVHEIKSEDLPEGFEGRTMEEKQQFFRDKFQQFKGEDGTFPGQPSQGFPGGENMKGQQFNGQGENLRRPQFQEHQNNNTGEVDSFNGVGPKPGTQGILTPLQEAQQRSFDSQRGFQGQSGEGQMPSTEGFHPVQSGQFPSPNSGTFQPPQGGEFKPPLGEFPQPSSGSGTFQPPQSGQFQPPSSGFQQPSSGSDTFKPPLGDSTFREPLTPTGGTFQQQPPPPSDGTFQPPPSTGTFQSPPPSGRAPQYNFFASILNLLLGNY